MQLERKCTFRLVVMNRLSVPVGIVVLSIGAFFVYIGLRAYLFPQVRGHLQGGAAFTGLGSLVVIIGIFFILWGIFTKGKTNIFLPPIILLHRIRVSSKMK